MNKAYNQTLTFFEVNFVTFMKGENKQRKIQCAIRSLPLRCKDQVSKAQDMDELKSTAQKILIMPAG